jgi:hypothetical protein
MTLFSCLQLDLLCQMEALESACWPDMEKNKAFFSRSIPDLTLPPRRNTKVRPRSLRYFAIGWRLLTTWIHLSLAPEQRC